MGLTFDWDHWMNNCVFSDVFHNLGCRKREIVYDYLLYNPDSFHSAYNKNGVTFFNRICRLRNMGVIPLSINRNTDIGAGRRKAFSSIRLPSRLGKR